MLLLMDPMWDKFLEHVGRKDVCICKIVATNDDAFRMKQFLRHLCSWIRHCHWRVKFSVVVCITLVCVASNARTSLSQRPCSRSPARTDGRSPAWNGAHPWSGLLNLRGGGFLGKFQGDQGKFVQNDKPIYKETKVRREGDLMEARKRREMDAEMGKGSFNPFRARDVVDSRAMRKLRGDRDAITGRATSMSRLSSERRNWGESMRRESMARSIGRREAESMGRSYGESVGRRYRASVSRHEGSIARTAADYEEPEWAAMPGLGALYSEILVYKKGAQIDTFNLNHRTHHRVGRDRRLCDIVLEHPTISRMHCVLQMNSHGMCFIWDMGSTHGTTLNGKLLQPSEYKQLGPGDKIVFGRSTRVYEFQNPRSIERLDLKRVLKEATGNRGPSTHREGSLRAREGAREERDIDDSEREEDFEEEEGSSKSSADGSEQDEDVNENGDIDVVNKALQLRAMNRLNQAQMAQMEVVERKLMAVRAEQRKLTALNRYQDAFSLSDGKARKIVIQQSKVNRLLKSMAPLEKKLKKWVMPMLGLAEKGTSKSRKEGRDHGDDEGDTDASGRESSEGGRNELDIGDGARRQVVGGFVEDDPENVELVQQTVEGLEDAYSVCIQKLESAERQMMENGGQLDHLRRAQERSNGRSMSGREHSDDDEDDDDEGDGDEKRGNGGLDDMMARALRRRLKLEIKQLLSEKTELEQKLEQARDLMFALQPDDYEHFAPKITQQSSAKLQRAAGLERGDVSSGFVGKDGIVRARAVPDDSNDGDEEGGAYDGAFDDDQMRGQWLMQKLCGQPWAHEVDGCPVWEGEEVPDDQIVPLTHQELEECRHLFPKYTMTVHEDLKHLGCWEDFYQDVGPYPGGPLDPTTPLEHVRTNDLFREGQTFPEGLHIRVPDRGWVRAVIKESKVAQLKMQEEQTIENVASLVGAHGVAKDDADDAASRFLSSSKTVHRTITPPVDVVPANTKNSALEGRTAHADTPGFVPCDAFDGWRDGYVFKKGLAGVGYYRDTFYVNRDSAVGKGVVGSRDGRGEKGKAALSSDSGARAHVIPPDQDFMSLWDLTTDYIPGGWEIRHGPRGLGYYRIKHAAKDLLGRIQGRGLQGRRDDDDDDDDGRVMMTREQMEQAAAELGY